MPSSGSDHSNEEIHIEQESDAAIHPPSPKEYIIRIPSLQESLLHDRSDKRSPLDFLKDSSSAEWFKKLKLPSPVSVFRQTVERREEISASVPSPVGARRHSLLFIGRINWASFFNTCKKWLKHPMNIALVVWFLCVAASATMLGLLLLGILNSSFPTKSSRNRWIEINNQILNALFTLMSLYQHPYLFHHLYMLCRWRSEDIVELRKIYCKNGAHRPHEWAHIMVAVVLFHITCFSQYALCGLYWGYSSTQRPEFADNFFFILGIVAPVSAGLYMVYSPLGWEVDSDLHEEPRDEASAKASLKLYETRVLVSNPVWAGGLLDCYENPTVCCLSFFCTCCIFGWNMERLGFGNMYVHLITFLLLCVAPFWIFNISALNIHNYILGDVMGVSGLVLCFFGLLYGGFWRIQMRKKFKLPRNVLCCGSASITDYVQWMFCWSCSLAQEVRTGNFYDIEDESFYRKPEECNERTDRGSDHEGHYLPNLISIGKESHSQDSLPHGDGEIGCRLALDDAMAAPVQQVTWLEDRIDHGSTIAPAPHSPLLLDIGESSLTLCEEN